MTNKIQYNFLKDKTCKKILSLLNKKDDTTRFVGWCVRDSLIGVETNDIDVTNNEAVMNGKDSIGYVTSGGFAHFVNKSVAFTYLDKDKINKENKIQIEINGDLFNCSLINEPLYDPSGQKMRS